MAKKYRLYCIALQGDRVLEGEFDSVDSARQRSADMGSRWIFYPVHVVTTRKGKIVDVALPELNYFVGRYIKTLQSELAGPNTIAHYLMDIMFA